ncbi:MAG: 6-phosphogluconolactonase [Nitrosomonas sp.]|nr:6-phosphogluconolactonase [Nitrosomonas sp.]
MQRIAFANSTELAHGFAEYAAGILSCTLNKQQAASLAIPGGNTPRFIFRYCGATITLNRITITLSDERWVSTDSEDSNERLVRENLLDHLPEETHFVGLKTWHDTPEQAIPEISRRLAKIPQPFTLTVLGIGEDGHIASLFPYLKLHERPHDTADMQCLAVNPSAILPQRVSLSLEILARSEHIALVATGYSKRRLLDQLSEYADPELPIVWLLQRTLSPVTVFETD